MNELNVESIRKYLQNKEVQEHITKRMLDAHSKATVTISRATGLFDFSESQLREWEKRELLKTERMALSEDSKTSKGHRQFSPDELDELALFRELLDQDYSLSDIPPNIDVIWKQIFMTGKRMGRRWLLSSRNARKSIRPPLRACSGIWRRVCPFIPYRRSIERSFAPTTCSNGSMERLSAAFTKWQRLFDPKGLGFCCFMRSSAVCISTNS